jgi:short-subunit dehydrogenase involved in D-alanine esterification of teichoic acids
MLPPTNGPFLIDTHIGWFIVIITEKREAYLRPIDAVKEEIRSKLQKQYGENSIRRLSQEIYGKYKDLIKINEAALAKVEFEFAEDKKDLSTPGVFAQ